MADDDPRIGIVLDNRYRIDERLSAGGMGTVYRATRLGLDRRVAVKFLLGSLGSRPDFVGRFEREALAMSRLNHPNCVPVIDYGVADAPYLVLEYVVGETLRELIAHGPVPPVRAVGIARQLFSALAHAHAHGVIHRDIKPENVVLAEVEGAGDLARLLDFGLAKLTESAPAGWSTASMAVGTPSYMSPEQARGEPVDHRTDLYSCGVLLFEMLTGRKPFVASGLDVLRMHVEDRPPKLGDVAGRRFPSDLEAFVASLLEKEPARRRATARAAIDAIDALRLAEPLVIESTRKSRDHAAERPPSPAASVADVDLPRRRVWPVLLAVVLVAVAGAVIAWRAFRASPVATIVDADAAAAPIDARTADAAASDAHTVRSPDADVRAVPPDEPTAARPLDAAVPSPPDAAPVPPPLDAAPPPPPPDAAPPPAPLDAAPPPAPLDAAPPAPLDAAPGVD